ncbi:hypothetical protein [Nonomuraea insulae]|uniref:Glyoxalase-like domain-containing protein n=1 Tax=Nonomuraea insulae TaxID=1616787 RepID=A0ABW1CS19_9ACTN
MSGTFFGASFDATGAARTARFWAAVLDREVADGADAYDAVVEAGDPSGGPRARWTTCAYVEGNEFDLIPG